MKPYSECDESPEVTECPDCGEIFAEDECPYCELNREDAYAVGSDPWHIGDVT